MIGLGYMYIYVGFFTDRGFRRVESCPLWGDKALNPKPAPNHKAGCLFDFTYIPVGLSNP